MTNKLSYQLYGDKAILIEWQAKISSKILDDILLFKEKISQEKLNVIDMIVGFHSLTLICENTILDFQFQKETLEKIYKKDIILKKEEKYLWEIPVCYEVTFGWDLEEISNKKKLSISEIIELHTAPLYTVFFIGFLPGFPYLSGLNEKLFVDRKPNPRLKVLKGAVGTGGKQTGIYPQETAGGWQIIGKTPINLFDVSKENPCLLKAGDQIKFSSISMAEYLEIEDKISECNYSLTKKVIHD